MSMRMMSAKSLMKRMEKTVRGYSAETGKAIKVEIEGEDTELDKKILDSLAEPLIHLTRNAMDHGIEPEADRRRAGKPPVATIRFAAALSGNEVLVRVSDDGRGIDESKVLASAKKRGVDVSGVKTKEEAIALIFLPGLSTKEQTSDISGRGVGMDAVKSYVESFGGSISIQTELSKGTSFTLRLPIGMSVIPAVIARANNEVFALSTSGLVETRTISSDAIVRNGDELYYDRNGQFIPCYDIEDYVFEGQRRQRMPSRQASLCVCETSKGLVAVRVQELISNIEIVVKSPPKPGRQAPYVTGVSILATGRPIFVISLGLLYERAIRPRLQAAQAARRSHAAA
jgi:two-component system chemotaxis sensor kinase CheA